MKTELPYRHEFKYRCTAAQLQVLKGRLDAVMALDSHAGAAGYTIRSMYFDNYENQYYYENENGTDPREKYRIRIYNADASRITLECKRKEHTKTLKTICPLTLEQFRGIMDGCCPFSDSDSAKLLNRFLYLQKTESRTIRNHMEQYHPARCFLHCSQWHRHGNLYQLLAYSSDRFRNRLKHLLYIY